MRESAAILSATAGEHGRTLSNSFGNPASRMRSASQSALKMGLTYEPGNARFKEMLADVQKKIEDARRGQAPSFMIK